MNESFIKCFRWILFLMLCSQCLTAQEICDNAIDDDGDGLIDLNDEECFCTSFIESSLIPNPSFEDMFCCPDANEMLECAEDWIQASAATSDYVHTCAGYLGNTSIPAFAPLPFPDGEGGIGFRDGQEFAGADYKEYVGACLTEAMVVGDTYRLDFFVGFQNNVPGSMSFDITFFGSTDCSSLPFGGNNYNIGCPLNAGNYVQLAQETVSGSNEWVNVVIEFVADQAYEVLVIGPSCAHNPDYVLNPYFYADRLALQEIGAFGTPFEDITGSICEDNLTLSVPNDPASSYQWYKDGIALIGETGSSIILTANPGAEGIYLVAINNADGCSLSQEYEVRIPPYYESISAEICETESFMVGTELISASGYYEVLLSAVDGCDSIVQLSLEVVPNTAALLQDFFCEGEIYTYHDLETTVPGTYEVSLLNTNGCDSIVQLELSMIEVNDGIELVPQLELMLGESADIVPDLLNPNLMDFKWYDENNELISENLILENFHTFENTWLYLEATDPYGCLSIDSLQILVNKSNIRLYVPNVFTPNGDGSNDYFRYYPSVALANIKTFAVFDRWGGTMYKKAELGDNEYLQGWDGTVKGKDASPGVYTYYIHAEFLDGTEEVFKGDVTLLR